VLAEVTLEMSKSIKTKKSKGNAHKYCTLVDKAFSMRIQVNNFDVAIHTYRN